MLKSLFPLSRSSSNDTGLVTKGLDTKTFLRANRHPVTMSIDRKVTLVRFCLFVLRLNVPVNNFSVMSGRSHGFLDN